MSHIKLTFLKKSFLLFFCLHSQLHFSQTKSTTIQTINGKKYYIHKVEKGQSLYGIAKTYSIDINSILAENDDAIDGLQNGQELKIPLISLLPKQNLAIDTNKYIYHKIAKGETVYAITKKYALDEKKLSSYNPTINSGLKEGEYLIVGEKGKTTIVKSVITKTANVPNSASDTYTVQKSETLYGISKKLKLSKDDLLKWNPEIKDGIKEGQILNLSLAKYTSNTTNTVNANPLITEKIQSKKDSILFNKPKKTSYTIGLFLPFKLTESKAIIVDELVKKTANFPQTQSLALDFYAGFKKAVDSISSKDFEITIRLFDTDEKDSLKIESICKTEDFKTLDAVFGPLYASVFKLIAPHSKKLGIPIVSPLIQQSKILYDNVFVSKVTPSQHTLIEGLADYCIDSLALTSNIMIVNATTKDQSYLKTFKNRYNTSILNKSLKDTIKEVKGIAGVKDAFVMDKKNVVILLTNNSVYLQDFITQLRMFSDKKDIVLMGFNSVSNINNLDQDYLNALQFHFAAPNHINFQDSLIRVFVKQYQDINIADPSEYYFQGFDIGNYYLTHLKTNGPSFFLNLDKLPMDGISTSFKFYRPDTETGFENRSVFIYKYSNHKLQKLGWK